MGANRQLKSRLQRSFATRGSVPPQELLDYAAEVDAFATGKRSPESLQVALCRYIDRVASDGRALSDVIDRTVEPPLADVVTEGTTMLLDGILRSKAFIAHQMRLASERRVQTSSGFCKPDVSVWLGDAQLVAVVECKTNLGYARRTWKPDFERRVGRLADKIASEAVFLLVATESNWDGFPPKDSRTGRVWLSLGTKGTWPGGGKNGEVPLEARPSPGVVAALIRGLEAALASATR